MARTVRLNDVWRMLDNCAAGYTRTASREYWNVKYNGLSYRSLPLGPHGRRNNPETESGHVRSLVRFFALERTCVDRYVDIG